MRSTAVGRRMRAVLTAVVFGALSSPYAVASAAPAAAATTVALPPAARAAMIAYLAALQARRYDRAFVELTRDERAYYGDADDFASDDRADGWSLQKYTIVAARTDGAAGAVAFVREQTRRRDPAHDVDVVIDSVVPLGAVDAGGRWRIKDPGRAQHAFASSASVSRAGLDIAVRKVAFYPGRIDATIRVTNRSGAFVTALPYGRTRLIDAAGRRFSPLAVRDWRLTDRVFYEGLHLAPSARYTGRISFVTPSATARVPLTLVFGPLLADGGDVPFDLAVTHIADASSGVPSSSR